MVGVSELADEADSKSVGGNTVWVRFPPPAIKFIRHKGCGFAAPFTLSQSVV